MAFQLDVRSISLACGVVHLTVAGVMTYVWSQRKTYPGFGPWTLSGWTAFMGILLVFLRGMLSDLLTVVIANTFLIGTALLLQIGLITFTLGRPRYVRYVLFLVVFVALCSVLTYGGYSLQHRLILVSVAVAIVSYQSAFIAWNHLDHLSKGIKLVVVATLSLIASVQLMRIIAVLVRPPASNNYMIPSTLQGGVLLAYLGCVTLLSVCFLVLNSQRLEQELLRSIEECKVLRGIIPICAYCKSVRDDAGAWRQVERYIQEHSEATFSHGICPECARKEWGKFIES